MNAEKTTPAQHILRILGDAPGLTTSQLREIPALRGADVVDVLSGLRARGVIARDGGCWRVQAENPGTMGVVGGATGKIDVVASDAALDQPQAGGGADNAPAILAEPSGGSADPAAGTLAAVEEEIAPSPKAADQSVDDQAGVIATRILAATGWTRGDLMLTANADAAFARSVMDLLGLIEQQAFALHFDHTGPVNAGAMAHPAFLTVEYGRVSVVFLTTTSFQLFLTTFRPSES